MWRGHGRTRHHRIVRARVLEAPIEDSRCIIVAEGEEEYPDEVRTDFHRRLSSRGTL